MSQFVRLLRLSDRQLVLITAFPFFAQDRIVNMFALLGRRGSD
jgi:hypothetical protein